MVLFPPVGIHQLRKALPKWLEDAENGLSELFRTLLNSLAEDLRYLDDRIKSLDENITENVQKRSRRTSLDDVAWRRAINRKCTFRSSG